MLFDQNFEASIFVPAAKDQLGSGALPTINRFVEKACAHAEVLREQVLLEIKEKIFQAVPAKDDANDEWHKVVTCDVEQAAATLHSDATLIGDDSEIMSDINDRMRAFKQARDAQKYAEGNAVVSAAIQAMDVGCTIKLEAEVEKVETSFFHVLSTNDYKKVLAFLTDNASIWATGPAAYIKTQQVVAQAEKRELVVSPDCMTVAKTRRDEGLMAVTSLAAVQAISSGNTAKVSFIAKLRVKGINFKVLPPFLASMFTWPPPSHQLWSLCNCVTVGRQLQ